MSGRRYSRYVLSAEGRSIGEKCVLYSPQRRVYLGMSGTGETKSRVYAWSGTARQAQAAKALLGVPEEFVLFLDGEEHGGA